MVQNKLTAEMVVERAEDLSFPQSVLQFMQGHIGIPPGGFPEPLRTRVLSFEILLMIVLCYFRRGKWIPHFLKVAQVAPAVRTQDRENVRFLYGHSSASADHLKTYFPSSWDWYNLMCYLLAWIGLHYWPWHLNLWLTFWSVEVDMKQACNTELIGETQSILHINIQISSIGG